MKKEGKARVIIENISPQVDGGLYPAKRTEGEQVNVTAAIYADGHDHIRAFVRVKAPKKRSWQSTELIPLGNDDWSGVFTTSEVGLYSFRVEAWIDYLTNWHDGFKKKAAADQYLNVELAEGALHLKEILKIADKEDGELISHCLTLFEDPDRYEEAHSAALSDSMTYLVQKYPLPVNVTKSKEFQVQSEFSRANFTAWYEFFPRSASHKKGVHGTFKDCEKLLPRIAELGFDVLYFPPIHPIGELNRKGKNNATNAKPGDHGSPWAIGSKLGGHKDIHPELGTLRDYKSLIKKAKSLGIDIALDIAFQCAPDHPYVKENPQWFKWRPDGTVQYAENPPKKYQDILPINFECDDWKNLWDELLSVITYWIDQGVNIFRVDNPHTKPIPFWQWAIAEVNKKYDNIIFLSEAFTRPKVMAGLAKAGYTQGYTYFTWRVTKAEIIEYMNELVYGNSRNYFRPNFWPNTPDILPYHLQYANENIFVARYALAATLSSNYGMYGPVYEHYENVPVEDKEEYLNSEKYEIKYFNWKVKNRLTEVIRLVNKARRENEALQSTWNISFCSIENDSLIAYLKTTVDGSNSILTVVNLDPHHRQAGFVNIPKNKLGIQGGINLSLRDLITGSEYSWTEEWNYVELDPGFMPFHLFKVEVKESNI
ncbi:MAG: alpha-1,4-glucan--maltose-1-phosphate maltosyltransferase [Bacteroidota bacterium]